jgi:hypothetical protein
MAHLTIELPRLPSEDLCASIQHIKGCFAGLIIYIFQTKSQVECSVD